MKKIRFGLAGPGIIAHKFANAIKNVEYAELVAIASRSIDRAREFADKYGVPQAYGSYEEMALSNDIDVVYVCTAHPFHSDCVDTFIRAGKHVLCEKPLTINASDANYLETLAKECGVFLMEAMWTKFLPAINEAVKIAKSGEVGEIMGIEADFCYRSTPEEEAKLFDVSLAGGSLLDVGIYGLHFASLFFGNDPQEIKAVAHIEGGVDLHTIVNLQYKEGAIASISSAIALQKPETAFVYGTDGYIRIPTFYGAKELFVCKNGEEKHIALAPIGDGFEEEIIEVCECIVQGKTESDTHPLSDTIAIIKQMDKIRDMIGVKYPF